jgi:hypothetical protein
MRRIAILIPLFWFSCNSQNLDSIFNRLNEQCDLLPQLNSSEWVIDRAGGTLLEVKPMNNEDEYLNLNIESEPILGYYTRRTSQHHLQLRLQDCDTIMFYSIEETDTTFILGYYQHLFNSRKLNSGQQRYFRRNRDSLVHVRSGNLPTLPETDEPLK